MELEPIGKYKILSRIGQGSMGVVYKAQDPVLNRFVAVKTISARLSVESEARKRFLREAQSAARLNHPNIVTVYDFGEERGHIYMAMEFLEGKDLKQLIGTPSLSRLEDKLKVMEQICDGLAFAHEKDVVHRDLKPANIHIQPSGDVKIMDFGLARFGASELTATGTTLGTPNYMSPEQVRGQKADARSDIFSLGAVFYEVLTHHKAFDADSLHAVLFQVAENDPAPARQWAPDLPEIIVQVLETALAKDPAQRFPNAGAMRAALHVVDQVVHGELDEDEGLLALAASSSEATVIDAASDTVMAPRSATRPGPPLARDMSRRGITVRGRTIGSRPLTRHGPRPDSARGQKPIAAPPSPSRLPLYVGTAALLLALGAGSLVLWMRTRPTPGPTPPPRDLSKEQVGALTEALVTSQIELAQESLKDKNYEEAVARAEGALKLDPQNAEAKQIMAKTKSIMKDLDTAADEARTAVQAGDTEKASQALAKVLAINPNHPVAAELSAQLNRYFRAQAEDARRIMSDSRVAADRSKSGSQSAYAAGTTTGREAEALFGKGEFAVSTRKFLDARDAYDRARRAAEAAHVPPTPPPAFIAAVLPRSPAPEVAPPAPSLPPAGGSLAPGPRGASPPLPAAPAPGEEAAIRKVVEDYGRAIQSKDLSLFKTVKPNLSGEEEKRLREIFRTFKSYKVNVIINTVQVNGQEARVRLSRQDVIDGNPVSLQQSLVLQKGPSGWTIRDIGP